ncbi:uncharacterized protein [Narcine bancroftii]|uniref:uncharacterized protein isoform X2 n=1 Tax=Narcine bancroftii TaxID=1343680 RepID=UPI0038322A40
MAELSVNDHLEGILSDFEALKRSFEIDDVNDEPPFTPVSPLSSTFSPSPTTVQSPKLTENFAPSPSSYHTKINRSSSTTVAPGSAQYRKVSSSFSFNQGSKPIPRANGSAAGVLGRVASFHSKVNPNSFGQSSSSDVVAGLHGSTSSLVYPSRLNSVSSPLQSPLGCQDPCVKANFVSSPALKKYSSQGNMIHSEVDRPPTSVNETSHGSMPSLDLHIAEDLALERKMHKSSIPQNSGVQPVLAQSITPGHSQRTSQRAPWIASTATYSSLSTKPAQNLRELGYGSINSFSNNVAGSTCKALESQITSYDHSIGHVPKSHFIQNVTTSSPIQQMGSNQGVSMISIHPSGDFQSPAVAAEPISESMHQFNEFKLVAQPQMVQVTTPARFPVPDLQAKLGQNSGLNGDPMLILQTMDYAGPMFRRDPSFSKSAEFGIHYLNSNIKLADNIYHDRKIEDEIQDPRLENEVRVHLWQQGLGLKELNVNMAERTQETGLICSEGFKKDVTGRDLFGYVGIEAVLDQMRRKAMKTGFEFNIMVVVIEEKGVKMNLTVIDTPGFGDQINNKNCWEPIVKYINEQYEKYLREEININRKKRIPDTRIHCCVYFVPPTGHWLRPLDIEFMNRLSKIVNIVPVIAKADTLTLDERRDFKQRIRQDLRNNSISVYPQTEFDEDSEDKLLNDAVREKIPFAVVGTDQEHQVNGKKILGRKTKWGIIEVENGAHCEFANLRDLLIRSHLQDLKEVTHRIHYETYRVERLNENNGAIKASPRDNYVSSKQDLENIY